MDLADVLDDYGIAQYGVRGMRWGVRRPVGTGGLVTKTGGTGDHDLTAKAVAKARTHGTSSLTNKEFDAYNARFEADRRNSAQKSSADHERATNALTKAHEHGRSSLSNEELTALTKRIESERKFVQLTSGEKSALQKQVDQMRLEKDYRSLKAESKAASKSTGRKLVESLVQAIGKGATGQASKYAEDLVKEMLGIKPSLKEQIDSMRLQKEHHDLTQELLKRGLGKPRTTGTKKASAPGTPFKVNPNKVRFTKPTPYNNLPNLKPTGP